MLIEITIIRIYSPVKNIYNKSPSAEREPNTGDVLEVHVNVCPDGQSVGELPSSTRRLWIAAAAARSDSVADSQAPCETGKSVRDAGQSDRS